MKKNLINLIIGWITFSFCPYPKSFCSDSEQKLTIENIFPQKGIEGDSILNDVRNFNPITYLDNVDFNGVKANVLTATSSNLKVIPPTLTSTGKVSVKTTKKTASQYNSIVQKVSVYICGSLYIGGINGYIAFYWKNGNEIILGNGSYSSYASSIDVFGNNVYVAGRQGYPSSAVYWKNGISIFLSNSGHLYSIKCYQNDIYALGADNGKAILYKNNLGKRLVDSKGEVRALAVSDGDTYLAGQRIGNGEVITYWKNGDPFKITGTGAEGDAYSIFVIGKDIYIAGRECSKGHCLAKCWKNDKPISLENSNADIAKSISVDGNDVYVIGNDRRRQAPFFWKNGKLLPLEKSGSDNCELISVKVFEHDVYVIGTRLEGLKEYACCWKNGNLLYNIEISRGTDIDDICIVREQ